jgi:NADH:ubiquinone oxidoreductase subunit C
MTDVLSRTDEALTPEEIESFLRKRLGDGVLGTVLEYDTFTVVLTPAAYRGAAVLCRDERLLAFDMFDTTIGVDERDQGLSVVTILYSTTKGVRICLQTLAEGGREAPVVPSLADLYPGANWSERETWDMFGIEFEGHPGLAPRILTVENFEGWPLRKDFYLTSRIAKPWPGVKEPAETDEEGNVIERVPGPGEAPGPMALDKVMADQAKLANPGPEAPEEAVTEPAGEAPDEVEVAVDSGDVRQSDKQEVEETANENASAARVRAEEQRKAAAEARARKAAERAAEERPPVTTPEEDVPDVPKGAAAAPEAGVQGGPPAEGPADAAGSNRPQPTVEGGISETVEQARELGTTDPDVGEPPVTPQRQPDSVTAGDPEADARAAGGTGRDDAATDDAATDEADGDDGDGDADGEERT